MSELKTVRSNDSVTDFIAAIENDQRRTDASALLTIFHDATGMNPVMWGTSIIGYGQYHYKSDRSSQEGDWPLVGFSPRKASLTIYALPEIERYDDYLSRLGKCKTSVACIYISKLSDVDVGVLSYIIRDSVEEMKHRYPSFQST